MIKEYIIAGYPCLYCNTLEPQRALLGLAKEVEELSLNMKEPFRTYGWDVARGFYKVTPRGISDISPDEGEINPTEIIAKTQTNIPPESPLYPLAILSGAPSNTIIFVQNYDKFLDNRRNAQYLRFAQQISNDSIEWKATGKTLIVISPSFYLPPEVDRLFQLVDFPLPTEDEIKEIMMGILAGYEEFINTDWNPEIDPPEERFLVELSRDAVIAAKGMTHLEVENALSLALTESITRELQEAGEEGEISPSFDPLIIGEIKKQQVKKTATLEISSATHTFDDVVGLENLIEYLSKTAMNPLAQGILVVGVPGTGKTYTAEALANELNIPAILVSFERMRAAGGGIVGQAEQQALNTFKVIDAMAPAIAIFDEIEKGLSGIQSSGHTDAGTKAGVGSIFLKWLDKKPEGVYVVATCNNIADLPPEFKRAGRWDSIWGVDLPSPDEIAANLVYYSKFYDVEHILDEVDDKLINDALCGYSHAELKTIVKHCKMLQCGIAEAMKYVRPIRKVDAESVERIQKYIKENTIPAGHFAKPKALRPKVDMGIVKERKIHVKRKVKKVRKGT